MALNGNIEIGSMTINSDVNINLEPGKTYGIPNGYHSGNSIISVASLASQTPANAVDDDIISPYRGWVNGLLVTGNVTQRAAYTNYVNMIRESSSWYSIIFPRGAYLEKSGYNNPSITIPQEMVAAIGNVTPEKIAKGKSYLGKQGTYTSDATVTPNDIKYGYTAYSNGELVIGALKTTSIRNVGIAINSTNSVVISWNNPSVGPYQGTRIRVSTSGHPGSTGGTVVYEGTGSNTLPDGRSSVIISDLVFGESYYFSLYSYCGDLAIGDIFNLDIIMYTSMTTGQSFNSVINKSALSFSTSLTPPPTGAPVIDVSNNLDGTVVTWFDESNNTQYLYTPYPKVYLNANSSSMFQNCAYNTIDVSKFDTSKVTNMGNMFGYCSSLTSLVGLSGFNTSSVTTMSNMFRSCYLLTTLDLSSFNTINVVNMFNMFSSCRALTALNLSNFNTSNVTDMNNMFASCRAITTLNLSNFNTAKVTNMGWMFSSCIALTTLNISNFNTAKVTNMNSMFSACTALASLNISSFDTFLVTNMDSMFGGNELLTTITYGDDFINTNLPVTTTKMFYHCPANKPEWSNGSWNGDGDFTKPV